MKGQVLRQSARDLLLFCFFLRGTCRIAACGGPALVFTGLGDSRSHRKGERRRAVPGGRPSLRAGGRGPRVAVAAPPPPKHRPVPRLPAPGAAPCLSHTRAPAPGLEPGSGSPDPAGTRHRLLGTSPNFGRNFGRKRAVRPLPSRHLQLPARRPGPPRAPRGPPGSPRGPPGRGRPLARPPAQSGPGEPHLGRRSKAALPPSPCPSSPPYPPRPETAPRVSGTPAAWGAARGARAERSRESAPPVPAGRSGRVAAAEAPGLALRPSSARAAPPGSGPGRAPARRGERCRAAGRVRPSGWGMPSTLPSVMVPGAQDRALSRCPIRRGSA